MSEKDTVCDDSTACPSEFELKPLSMQNQDRSNENTGVDSNALDSRHGRNTIDDDDVPTNEFLLVTALVSFVCFAIIQTAVAFIAASQALLGDTAAMAVDTLTYAFNLYAETQKSGSSRKTKLVLELIVPLFSVSFLLIVTFVVTGRALGTLLEEETEEEEETYRDPNLQLMFIFSCANLVLDLVNVMCFARAKHALGYKTSDSGKGEEGEETAKGDGKDSSLLLKQQKESRSDDNGGDAELGVPKGKLAEEDDDDSRNLNMCSAYTHVMADTMRSISVIFAAMVAWNVEGVSPKKADAYAAIIVSTIIVVSLIPLLKALVQTTTELRELLMQEATEDAIEFEVVEKDGQFRIFT